MIRPSEAQALRCLFVKKLWDEHSSLEPVLMLLAEILAYIPRPLLSLNCPMEQIVLNVEREPDFIFARGGLVYGIFVECDTINKRTLHPFGDIETLAKTNENRATFYYNADISHLYVLYDDDGPSLLDYDVKGNKVNEVYKIPLLSKLGVWPIKMVVMKDEVFFVVDWHEYAEVYGQPAQKGHMIGSIT
ncbi:hypothetical protein FOL47_010678 [Perkinsus chesapeaki]|uniref:Uncharacterized protein n=1 Tax=Perkinsus chesapeaki TaxID=330153 RepID=A0A7J6MPT5_PERCH|nr:hypothetical protein FOL47_010678 [Perkinsus chesapeaki]